MIPYLILTPATARPPFFQLYRAGTFDEPLTRLYAAELVLAVSHLHALGFVHRDLKVRVYLFVAGWLGG